MTDLMKQAADLRAQAAALEAQAEQERQAVRATVVNQVKAMIAEHGISGVELGMKGGRAVKNGKTGRSHPSAGKKVAIKFQDSNGNKWTGRGVQPRWLTAALAAGAKLDSFAV